MARIMPETARLPLLIILQLPPLAPEASSVAEPIVTLLPVASIVPPRPCAAFALTDVPASSVRARVGAADPLVPRVLLPQAVCVGPPRPFPPVALTRP